MKVLSVVGARPQFVKAAPVSRALRRRHDEVLVHTGQHYDEEMSDVFFGELDIPEPEYNLGVGSDSPGAQTAAMIRALEPVVTGEAPDAVLVYGDTNSTLAAAIVTAKLDPALAHVEAGLRSFNRSMPEEHNRVLTDHAADLLLAPTDAAVQNLRTEGLADRAVETGDVMYDALLDVRERTDLPAARAEFGVTAGEYLLATVHRPRNTDDPDRLAAIVDALAAVDDPVVFPAHPRTVAALDDADLLERARSELWLTDPLGYVTFVSLLDGAERVVTDSGGVQKEAFFLDAPCVTLREETEWVATVEAGWNVLVGADTDAVARALARPFDLDPDDKPAPYGDGDAASRICDALADRLE